MCSKGMVSNVVDILSNWETQSISRGDTLKNRMECWNLAKQNVPSAVGIYFDYTTPYCRAIDDASFLMSWPTSITNDQDTKSLCILPSHIRGNFKYKIIIS